MSKENTGKFMMSYVNMLLFYSVVATIRKEIDYKAITFVSVKKITIGQSSNYHIDFTIIDFSKLLEEQNNNILAYDSTKRVPKNSKTIEPDENYIRIKRMFYTLDMKDEEALEQTKNNTTGVAYTKENTLFLEKVLEKLRTKEFHMISKVEDKNDLGNNHSEEIRNKYGEKGSKTPSRNLYTFNATLSTRFKRPVKIIPNPTEKYKKKIEKIFFIKITSGLENKDLIIRIFEITRVTRGRKRSPTLKGNILEDRLWLAGVPWTNDDCDDVMFVNTNRYKVEEYDNYISNVRDLSLLLDDAWENTVDREKNEVVVSYNG